MCTLVRPEISKRNKYWISKHRHYELKHFCLQYPIWKQSLYDMHNSNMSSSIIGRRSSGNLPGDSVGNFVVKKIHYTDQIKLIEKTAEKADKDLAKYILKAVTEGLSYSYLKSRLEIPCTRDMYYDRYRRFFWLLSQERK